LDLSGWLEPDGGTMTALLTCPQCGGDWKNDDQFCGSCGFERILADIVDRLRRATLGEFDILRPLGRGGMAAVFLAHEIALDRKVAIKVMSPGLVLGEGMVERFKQEAITIAQLYHPGIVSLYSVRQAEGLHFFVMRYVEGRSLEEVLQHRRLPLPVVRSVLYQVGTALAYAHRSGVVHRDIKPANILIDRDGNAVVTDFGIAKAAERPSQTLTGALVGTPVYMSPEQCRGGEVSGQSDQYSLGAVAYELLTGEPPFSGSTLTIMQAHVDRAPRPIPELRADCPPEVATAVLRMLEKDPARRWPRLADALTALGAEPLAEDHPLRAELTGDVQFGVADSLTPTSPIPLGRVATAPPPPARPATGISIMPAPASLEVGDSFRLVAVLLGHNGTRLPPRVVEWQSDAPGVLRVDAAAGTAVGLAAGTATVTASCQGVSAQLRVEIASARADDIVIEPMTEPLQSGEEVRLEATARDKHGWPVYRPVVWQSGDTTIAEVTPHGTIRGGAPGTVRITAVLDDARASLVIPVLPPRVAGVDIAEPPTAVVVGRSVSLRATPVDRLNTPLPGRPVEWSSSDEGIATVTDDGRVAGVRPGSVVLTAMCEGARAMVRVGVVAAEPWPSPAEPGLVAPIPRRRSRRARRRAVVAALGLALAAGVVWLARRPPAPVPHPAPEASAYLGGTIGVDTARAAVAVVITERPTRPVRPDSQLMLRAEALDAARRPVPGAAVVWSSSDSAVARVEATTGRVVAVRPGRAVLVATSGTSRDSVSIVVRRPGVRLPAVQSIAIEPVPSLTVGAVAALQAHAFGAGGDSVPGADLTWSSSNPEVATVEPLSGVVHGIDVGTAKLTVRSGRSFAATQVTVRGTPVAALQILGGRPMAVGEVVDLRIAARDARGEELPGVAVSWTSSDSTVAAVDGATGMVVGRAPGMVTIVARAEAAVSSIRLSVLPRPERLTAAGEAEPTDPHLLAGVEECYGAVRTRDVPRLTSMWRPETGADQNRLAQLGRVLRDLNAKVGPRVDHVPTTGQEAASMQFGVPLTWRESGGARALQLVFRADFVRAAGRWEMSSCRVIGQPRF
jgi:uncharacterized protein YjdB